MNRDLFIKKYGNNINDQLELERKWRVYLQEQEMIRLYQEKIIEQQLFSMGGNAGNSFIDPNYIVFGYFE